MDPAIRNQQSGITNQRSSGFTLIELLVVITVIAILAAILLSAVRGAYKASKIKGTETLVSMVAAAATQYKDSHGEYPPERAGSLGLYSSEALAVFLSATSGLVKRDPEAGVLPGEGPGARAQRDFLPLKESIVFDCNGNDFPEVVDGWGLPLVYNRMPFELDSSGKWADAIPAFHHPKAFDLFSVGAYGIKIFGDPKRTGLSNFESKALETNPNPEASDYKYLYKYEHFRHASLTRGEINRYISNW